MPRSWLKIALYATFVTVVLYLYFKPAEHWSSWEAIRVQKHKDIQFNEQVLALINSTVGVESNIKNDSSVRKNCDYVQVAMVCAGYNSTFALVTVVKSILFYRTEPLHFHLLVDDIAERTLTKLFETWALPQVSVSYYKVNDWIPRVAWIPNKHYSGVYGLLKLTLPEVLGVTRIIVLDTDVTILTDISILWRKFRQFTSGQMLGLVENQSDWYLKQTMHEQMPWPALGRGFNTGIILMDLKALRSYKFTKLWNQVTKIVLKVIPETTLADQDIINTLIKKDPAIVHELNCSWNIQLSMRTISDQCYTKTDEINVIHWNSPRKQDVKNRHADDFKKMHRVFLELDGNLLRKRLFNCLENKRIFTFNEVDPCKDFTRGASITYRTHPFIMEYEPTIYNERDVALVTQCSADRITNLEELCRHWPGTISVALYMTDAEVQNFLSYVHGSLELRSRKNIMYHVVYKEGEFYPINYLRNIATAYVPMPLIFQLDIDFLPQYGLYENLMNYIVQLNMTDKNKTALIIPAFETQRYRFTFPNTKVELIKSLKRGIFYTFRYHVWSQGHAATNYTLWRSSLEPYEVSWEPDFEPYIVVSKKAPQYDTRFIGFGWNKVSYITHLAALNFKFIVLPDAFIIHRPHAPSLDIGKFRSDSLYRRCLKKLKDIFVQELVKKYGRKAKQRLKKIITKDDKSLKTAQ